MCACERNSSAGAGTLGRLLLIHRHYSYYHDISILLQQPVIIHTSSPGSSEQGQQHRESPQSAFLIYGRSAAKSPGCGPLAEHATPGLSEPFSTPPVKSRPNRTRKAAVVLRKEQTPRRKINNAEQCRKQRCATPDVVNGVT